MNSQRPILITGAHSSGTTWLGKMIATHTAVGYIHEPFHPTVYPHQIGRCAHGFKHWFTYVCLDNQAPYLQPLQDTLNFSYNLTGAIQRLLSAEAQGGYREPARIIRDYGNFTAHHLRRSRPLMKDPIALFSSEWLAAQFNMQVIVLIRHPLAFVGSLKTKQWHFPFTHFLAQPLLMQAHFPAFAAEINQLATVQHDIIEQGALLWTLIYSVVLKLKQHHPNWLFVRHEDISNNPLDGFSSIFETLGLDYADNVQRRIREFTSSKNTNTYDNKIGMSRKMDSKGNIKSWQYRLNPTEIDRVRAKVQDLAHEFYPEFDWN